MLGLLIVLGAVAYAGAAGLTAGAVSYWLRHTDFESDRELASSLSAMFWPIAVPLIMLYLVGRTAAGHTKGRLMARSGQPQLPKATAAYKEDL